MVEEPKLISYVNSNVPRVLTQLDRDPDSPTFGCFDRNFWHYKIRDFPSSILQQGMFLLDGLRCGQLFPRENVDIQKIEKLCIGAINALARQIDRGGGLSEYYPYERSYPPAAFGLYAVANVLLSIRNSTPSLLEQIEWGSIKRLTMNLIERTEPNASNQYATGVAGLALASRFPELEVNISDVSIHFERLLEQQSQEGWFEEYGGPDLGYLSVTIDAMVDYYFITSDERAKQAINKAVDFITLLIGIDGRHASTLNSRNTDYIVPYGLVRSAAWNSKSAWIVETLFHDADDSTHFLSATDDRYLCHYIFASAVRAGPFLGKMQTPVVPLYTKGLWLPECGFFSLRDEAFTVFVAAKKGGLLRIHRNNDPAIVDHGWRIYRADILKWSTNWWNNDNTCTGNQTMIEVSGRAQPVRHFIPSPLKHIALRFIARIFHGAIIGYLKSVMIFSRNPKNTPEFQRTITIRDSILEVVDVFKAHTRQVSIRPSVRQNMRHVASSDSFSIEEFEQVPGQHPPSLKHMLEKEKPLEIKRKFQLK